MRLLQTTTYQVKDFSNKELPKKYAILSHCWDEIEITYQDMQKLPRTDTRMAKIAACCSLAKRDGYKYVWIDTCCIDKSSSAELSEAINSMFLWYERSDVCYVFLSDLHTSGQATTEIKKQFSECRWFRRGWTLQELIAPHDVRFYDADGIWFGTKTSLADVIEKKTKIPVDYLTRQAPFQDATIAQRMSWASDRSTKRHEDVAYSLLGLFNVHIPLLYGEGREKAFERLQHAIIAQSDDETIFTWLSHKAGEPRGMLAKSPAEFAMTGHSRPIHYERKRSPATSGSRGIAIDHAYPHPLSRAWDQICELLFGGSFSSASKVINLRLDCEITDEQGRDSWVGVSLQQSITTGNWYRINAHQICRMRQNTTFNKVYPTFVGWKTIYIKEPTLRDLHVKVQPQFDGDKFSKYSRSIWITLLWQAADILSATSCWWFVCAFHVQFGIPFANKTLSWAYLTGYWQIQVISIEWTATGTLIQSAMFLLHILRHLLTSYLTVFRGVQLPFIFDNLVLGMCGWGVNQATYDSLNIWTALLGALVMLMLQIYFDMRPWRALSLHGGGDHSGTKYGSGGPGEEGEIDTFTDSVRLDIA